MNNKYFFLLLSFINGCLLASESHKTHLEQTPSTLNEGIQITISKSGIMQNMLQDYPNITELDKINALKGLLGPHSNEQLTMLCKAVSRINQNPSPTADFFTQMPVEKLIWLYNRSDKLHVPALISIVQNHLAKRSEFIEELMKIPTHLSLPIFTQMITNTLHILPNKFHGNFSYMHPGPIKKTSIKQTVNNGIPLALHVEENDIVVYSATQNCIIKKSTATDNEASFTCPDDTQDINKEENPVQKICLAPNNPHILAYSRNDQIFTLDMQANKHYLIGTLPAHNSSLEDWENPANHITWSNDGTKLAIACEKGCKLFWLNQTQNESVANAVFDDEGGHAECYGVAFNQDGSQLITGGYPSEVLLINIDNTTHTIEEPVQINHHTYTEDDDNPATVRATAFSPDNQYAVSIGDDNDLYIWNTQTNTQRVMPQISNNSTESTEHKIAFSSDGSLCALTSFPQVINIWNRDLNAIYSSITIPHISSIESIQFTQDNRELIILQSNDDHQQIIDTYRIFPPEHIVTSRQITQSHTQEIEHREFSPQKIDGRVFNINELALIAKASAAWSIGKRFYLRNQNDIELFESITTKNKFFDSSWLFGKTVISLNDLSIIEAPQHEEVIYESSLAACSSSGSSRDRKRKMNGIPSTSQHKDKRNK